MSYGASEDSYTTGRARLTDSTTGANHSDLATRKARLVVSKFQGIAAGWRFSPRRNIHYRIRETVVGSF